MHEGARRAAEHESGDYGLFGDGQGWN